MVTVALAPLAKSPRSQTIVLEPAQAPTVGVTERSPTPAGNTSVNSTSVAVSGPLLVTVIVYVTLAPNRRRIGAIALGQYEIDTAC